MKNSRSPKKVADKLSGHECRLGVQLPGYYSDRTTVSGPVVGVQTDGHLLERAIGNLIDNALRHVCRKVRSNSTGAGNKTGRLHYYR
jgi:K+-sensing histidine kinase KdpD